MNKICVFVCAVIFSCCCYSDATSEYEPSRKKYPELTNFISEGHESKFCGYVVSSVEEVDINLDKKPEYLVNWWHDCGTPTSYFTQLFKSIHGVVVEFNPKLPFESSYTVDEKTYDVALGVYSVSGNEIKIEYGLSCNQGMLLTVGACSDDVEYTVVVTYVYEKSAFLQTGINVNAKKT